MCGLVRGRCGTPTHPPTHSLSTLHLSTHPSAHPIILPTQVFMLSSNAEVNDELLLQILRRGHSRLPVYEGDNKTVGGLVGRWYNRQVCRAAGWQMYEGGNT